ncbi:component 7 (COG7) protein [Rhizoctonia solani AG-3 Rhs1AP]|uniref:Conserved oligomeric Golgi complex subunit 7 n=1 Tax=Rhizoctonia solani AG-3 Rhs1AP TaxID=1086054 RepID=X8JJZ9_9AGAM|nr:component 7 (COG7) protein [Rhizoctonia solani AG-3 Rhs1AP]
MPSDLELGIESLDLDTALSRHGDNIVDWVNELLDPILPEQPTSSTSDLGNLDKTIVGLIARFDVIGQETASRLDTTIADVTRTMPRLNFDVQVMREAALSLQSALHTLQSSSATNTLLPSNNETTSALERLHTLSQTHSNMTAAHELLKKAEAWSTLESDVTRLLANSEFDAAADRLAASTTSLQIFEGTSEYENAKALMVSLQNQLEAGLSTAVVNAVNRMDFETCKRYYLIFGRIQRESEFKYYYNGIRRASLIKLWTSYSEDTTTDLSFSDFFSKFFSEFLALVHAERQNMLKVYPDAQDCLAEFILTTVEALSPSISQRLETQREPDGLPALISALGTVQEFVSSASKTLEAMILFSPSLSTVGGTTPANKPGSLLRKPSHSRRASKRFSISQREGTPKIPLKSNTGESLETESIPPWELALLEPFLEHQSDYGQLELKYLHHLLLEKSQRRPTTDGAKRFHDTTTDAFGLAEDAIPRCLAFTHTYGVKDLVGAVDGFCQDVLEGCRTSCIPTASSSVPAGAAATAVPDEDLDYTAEDWSAFQLALRLLEGCRAAQDRLDTLESRVRTRIIQAHRLSSLSIPRTQQHLLTHSSLFTPETQNLLAQWDAGKMNTPLLVQTRKAQLEFTQACQALVRDTILSPLKIRLSGYALLGEWTEIDHTQPGSLKLPKFSTSATSTIQSVAEGLLNLPRLFEVYADDNALAFSLSTLPFIGEQVQEEEQGNAEVVTSTWLSSLTLSLCAHLTDAILPDITALTPMGARQLASDLEYLSNVVRTLGVEPEVLETWRAAAEVSDEEGIARVKEGKEMDQVFVKVAALRGWVS